jgi:hypothetical protein
VHVVRGRAQQISTIVDRKSVGPSWRDPPFDRRTSARSAPNLPSARATRFASLSTPPSANHRRIVSEIRI